MVFESTLRVEEDGDGYWRLTEDLAYQGRTDRFLVPAGFRTDFASVPRLFTWLVPTSGEYTKAAVLHDWLLEESGISRHDADGIFRRTMRELGVSDLRRYVMWGAVRIAGRLRDSSMPETLLIVLLAIFVVPVALPGALFVLVVLTLLWAVELGLWGALRLLGKETTKPRHFWWN
ncbi:MAG: DUF1353 domain-containing protein [Dehalococcoidia bacterium]|nr:DUF1353 domain-containing protein [Dehalococcoidia bacterium]